MTLDDIKQAIDRLSRDDQRKIRDYLNQSETQPHPARGKTPEERIQLMEHAAKQIREGFTDEEWAQIEADMNEEYIEPVDEDQWKD